MKNKVGNSKNGVGNSKNNLWNSNFNHWVSKNKVGKTFLFLHNGTNTLQYNILYLCIKYESCILKTKSLSCQNKIVDKVQLWIDLWPFDPKMDRYLLLTILHLCIEYERLTSRLFMSEPVLTKFCCDLDLWPRWAKCIWYLSLMILHLCITWNLYVENYASYRVRTKVLTDGQRDRRTGKTNSYRAPT